MDFPLLVATACGGISLAGHFASAALAAWRLSRPRAIDPEARWPAVTLIRPICGLDPIERDTLASTFRLAHAPLEILFCAGSATDRAVPYIRELLRQHPHVDARLLIGADGPGVNPKLDNVRKGWRAASHDWVILADSNVLMPEDYVAAMLSGWRNGVGAVCAPPIGTEAEGFWADVEAAYLNGYQARVQYAVDALGHGFAQGKSMLFDQPLLESFGGITTLDEDIAEDAATTKVVRANGRRVRLAPRIFAQPLGRRTFSQVLMRQCRWAQLRRSAFPALYAFEPLSMLCVALPSVVYLAAASGLSISLALFATIAAWFSAEALVALAAGWPRGTLAAALMRELLAPVVWLRGWQSALFAWRAPAATQAA